MVKLEFDFIDEDIQQWFTTGNRTPMPLPVDADKIKAMFNWAANHPSFHKTRHFYILLEVIKCNKSPIVYEDIMQMPMQFKNIALSQNAKARQLSQCIEEVPFLFRITKVDATKSGETFKKKVIYPNMTLIKLLIGQYPDGQNHIQRATEVR